MLTIGKIKIVGLTKEDFRCPICDRQAQQKLGKKDWIICPIHGAIEGNIRLAVSKEAA